MALVQWDPFRTLESVERDLGKLLARVSGRPFEWAPAVDVSAVGDTLVLHMDLPGMKRDDVSVVVTNDVLTVSGERREEHEETRDTWYSRERAFGAFSRSVTLPPGTDPAKVVAEFEDGVLEVRIPGAHPPREPRTVEVKQRIAKEKAPAERKAAKPPKAGATA